MTGPLEQTTSSMAEWTARYEHSVMNTFGTPQLVLASGEGCYVRDTDGTQYLDLLGGIAVNLLGYAHPAVVQAVSTQIATVGHVSNFFATTPQIQLAQKLLEVSVPGGAPTGSRVFFTNSGTESNECAIKMVRAHANASGAGRTKIIALDHCFHGRSTGALALTWKQQYRAPFEPLIPGIEFVPANDAQALEAAMGADVAGIFIEPIQGEAGVWPIEDSFLHLARDLATRFDALLVFDEVQSGLGRTGTWMAHHPSGVVPDVITVAKGLGGGMPIGACIGIGDAGSILHPGQHGTTFGGNPVCAAAGLAVLNTLDTQGVLSHVRDLGASWAEELAQVSGVAEVRGRGLMLGVELVEPIAEKLITVARQAGFILNTTGPSTIRLVPPLIITAAQTHTLTEALADLIVEASQSS